MSAQNVKNTQSGSYLIPNLILLAIIAGVIGYLSINVRKHTNSTRTPNTTQERADITKPQTQTSSQAKEIQKTDKPTVDLYVMSFCPFGNRAENTMAPVRDLLADKVNWNIHYIVTQRTNTFLSLHGENEVKQDLRELCVNKLYDENTHWDFMLYVNDNCGATGDCWQDAATATGADANEIETCMAESRKELLSAEAKSTQEHQVRGSPTMFINGVESKAIYNYENPDAIKSAICEAFETKPEECNTTLEASKPQAPSGRCN